MRWISCFVLLGLVIGSMLVGPAEMLSAEVSATDISRHPKPDVGHTYVKAIKNLPDANLLGEVDLIHTNLFWTNLWGKGDLLLQRATFDSATRWPLTKPWAFRPAQIMKEGKNPGLGLRNLHQQGVTGQGVAIAIIDQTLLIDHVEYRDRIRHYSEINANKTTELHGAAVASIAVGKSTGVAPGADLYYIGTSFGDTANIGQAIERILEINTELPPEKKIKVVSISASWGEEKTGHEEADAAVKKAMEQGVFVTSSELEDYYGFKFQGLGRRPGDNPDDPASYQPGYWWEGEFDKWYPSPTGNDRLLIPMDSRTTASWIAPDEYVFWRIGGWSWCAPWLAGLYALGLQVDPDLTPERFYKTALRTATFTRVIVNQQERQLGPIVNPEALISALQAN